VKVFAMIEACFDKKTNTMKKVILIYGLIAGAVVAGMMLITMPMYQNGTLNLDNGELLGYSTMIIALSMVFFGVKSYRDNYSKGSISFGKGFQVGILITLVACLIYALTWEVSYNQIGEDFTKKMKESYETKINEKMKSSGATEAEIVAKKKENDKMWEMYKNPLFRFVFTAMVEMFPVGLVISLISAGILRKKEILPADVTS
jgi:hypothetical protein